MQPNNSKLFPAKTASRRRFRSFKEGSRAPESHENKVGSNVSRGPRRFQGSKVPKFQGPRVARVLGSQISKIGLQSVKVLRFQVPELGFESSKFYPQIRPHRSVGAGRARGALGNNASAGHFRKNIVISNNSARGALFCLPGKRLRLQGHWGERFEGGFWVDFWLITFCPYCHAG